ncbi:MAG: hypothetical protein IK031_00295 [Bacteroidales bacterium]|nr:hypothetical protein [Bacteroidales bacterium]
MDVALLSRMITELMLDHDSLSLPGLGTFCAENMPASFSDRGYTINPPYRRLGFSAKESSDGLLAGLYAGSNGIGVQVAEGIIAGFAEGLSRELGESRSVELPGLGRLRSTREGHVFFVPAPDLDITPDACGLASVSLKTHAAALPEIVEASDAGSTTQCVPPAAEAEQSTVISTEAQRSGEISKRPRNKAVIWALASVAAVALVLGGFTALSRLAPSFTDRLLYTPEQLAIINTPEDGTDLPR